MAYNILNLNLCGQTSVACRCPVPVSLEGHGGPRNRVWCRVQPGLNRKPRRERFVVSAKVVTANRGAALQSGNWDVLVGHFALDAVST